VAPTLKQGLTVAAAVGAAAIGGTAMAGAAGNRTAAQTAQPGGYGGWHHGPGGRGPGRGETALTGETAEKVKAAALARVDGTVLRVETDAGGVYEAHIRKADGTFVEVKVNRAFEVTAVETHRGGPGGHRRGPGGPGRGGPQALTGATAEKVKSAALARVEGGTVLFTHADRDGGYEAHVRKADGTMVEVKVNRSFRVTAVEAHEHRGGARRP
jgi:uncharacterized membrane protein YkoI